MGAAMVVVSAQEGLRNASGGSGVQIRRAHTFEVRFVDCIAILYNKHIFNPKYSRARHLRDMKLIEYSEKQFPNVYSDAEVGEVTGINKSHYGGRNYALLRR